MCVRRTRPRCALLCARLCITLVRELVCLAELILVIYYKILQFAKLKSPQKFPAMRYSLIPKTGIEKFYV